MSLHNLFGVKLVRYIFSFFHRNDILFAPLCVCVCVCVMKVDPCEFKSAVLYMCMLVYVCVRVCVCVCVCVCVWTELLYEDTRVFKSSWFVCVYMCA